MPPDKPIEWSPRAKKDLRLIWSHYARVASLEVGDSILHKVSVETERIGRHPTPGRDHDEFPGLRRLLVHPYTVFFRITPAKAEVVRVLHEERDFPTLLEGEY
jgi:plasmid stabilization system protein ParE